MLLFGSVGVGDLLDVHELEEFPMDEVGLDDVVHHLQHESLVLVVPAEIFAGYLDGILPMESGSDVRNFVSNVMAFFVGLVGDAFVHMVLGGMPFHPSEFHRCGTFSAKGLVKVVPEITIADKLPWKLGLGAVDDVVLDAHGAIDKDKTVRGKMNGSVSADSYNTCSEFSSR